MTSWLGALFLLALSLSVLAQPAVRELRGRVIDHTGAGLPGAMVIASGTGFNGWAETRPDGSFHIKAAGRFFSVRHVGLKPQLLKTETLVEPVVIKMESLSERWRIPACGPRGRGWIGDGLRINAGRSSFQGPVNGEHDVHWFVRLGKDTLHMVDGYAWHSGLPGERHMVSSETISVRSWERNAVVGLDISGRTKDGRFWRWLGAPLAHAIEYNDVAPAAAAYFDKLMESVCLETNEPPAE